MEAIMRETPEDVLKLACIVWYFVKKVRDIGTVIDWYCYSLYHTGMLRET